MRVKKQNRLPQLLTQLILCTFLSLCLSLCIKQESLVCSSTLIIIISNARLEYLFIICTSLFLSFYLSIFVIHKLLSNNPLNLGSCLEPNRLVTHSHRSSLKCPAEPSVGFCPTVGALCPLITPSRLPFLCAHIHIFISLVLLNPVNFQMSKRWPPPKIKELISIIYSSN